jgi:hypothetical protein
MGSELSYQLYGMINPQVNDPHTRSVNKYISGLSRPFMNVLAATYTVPKFFTGNRMVSQVLRDWQISAMLRYASATPIRVPTSSGNLDSVLGLASDTFDDRVSRTTAVRGSEGQPDRHQQQLRAGYHVCVESQSLDTGRRWEVQHFDRVLQ